MSKKSIIFIIIAASVVALLSGAAMILKDGKMRRNKDDFSLIRGANYVPSYAKNDVQTWLHYDHNIIDRELGYAEKLRLNSVRIFLQYLVYEDNP